MTDKEIIKALEYYQSIDIIRKDGKSPLSLLTAEIRAEAIKECIEKLKDLSYESDLYDRNERWVRAVTIDELDEAYKEMVGEQG